MFDRRFVFTCKKSLRTFSEFRPNILIVDGTPNAIHLDSRDLLIEISRWNGRSDDVELLKLAKIIKQKWGLTPRRNKWDHNSKK